MGKHDQKEIVEVVESFSNAKALSLKDPLLGKSSFWDSIKDISLKFFISDWLGQFERDTRKNYECYIRKLVELNLINIEQTLEIFNEQPHERILDQIKRVPATIWKEGTKQVKAAVYLSFTGYLQRLTQGKMRKAIPAKHGANKTFKKVREKVASESLVQREWLRILEELKKINPRDCLIIKMCLHGGKRISEVLSLMADQIDFQTRQVTFLQSKTRGIIKEVRITYPEDLMSELKSYVGERRGLAFISQYGKKSKIHSTQLNRNLKLAAQRSGIEKKISPHVFRTTLITYLRSQGFPDSEIMKITGHSSSSMIAMYDKTSQAENPSKIIRLWG
jgi:integrase